MTQYTPNFNLDLYESTDKPNLRDQYNAAMGKIDTQLATPVTSALIEDGAVTSAKIADGAVATADIADGAVTEPKLANGAVTTSKVANGTITTGKIGNDAVTSDKIAYGAVTADKVADDAVTTNKVADGAVTEPKLANAAVTSDKVADGAVIAGKLGSNAVASGNIADGAVIAGKLGSNAVATANVANGAITPEKLSFGMTGLFERYTYEHTYPEGSRPHIYPGFVDLEIDLSGETELATKGILAINGAYVRGYEGGGAILVDVYSSYIDPANNKKIHLFCNVPGAAASIDITYVKINAVLADPTLMTGTW